MEYLMATVDFYLYQEKKKEKKARQFQVLKAIFFLNVEWQIVTSFGIWWYLKQANADRRASVIISSYVDVYSADVYKYFFFSSNQFQIGEENLKGHLFNF